MTGSPCRVTGRTTNRRPRVSPSAAVGPPGPRGRAVPPGRASSPSGSSATGRADRSRCTCSRTRASRRSRRSATSAPSPRPCSASSSTTASCRSRSSNTNEQNTPVGIELPRAEAHARVGSINVEAVGLRAQVRVVLVDGERELTGYAEGSIAARGAAAARRHRDARRRPPGATGRGGDPHLQRRDQPDRQQLASRWSPWSTSTRRPSSSCPGPRSCVATATTRWRAPLLDATNRRLARVERGTRSS